MILYNLKKNKNKKMPNAYGKYYAYPVVTQTIGMDGLATHMSGHNTPFSPGAIKGMLTDMVICVRELALQGIAVKIDNLAIFSIGIKNKLGADTEKDFSITKNIEGVKLRARATGELMSDKLNLDATLKKATALSGQLNATISLRCIEVIALILKNRCFTQYGKTMGKTTWNKELAMIILGQFHSHMLAIGRRTLANIHSHIEHGTLHAAHQLRLGEWRALEMKSAHHAIGRHTLVVLAEMDRMAQYRSHLLVKFTLRETLEEIATGILEDARLNDEHAINISFDYFHILVL